MHPKMMTTLSNFHFTPYPLATAKPEPKTSVTNQSMVIDRPTTIKHDPKKPHTSTSKSVAERSWDILSEQIESLLGNGGGR
jgi:hypothetical protein